MADGENRELRKSPGKTVVRRRRALAERAEYVCKHLRDLPNDRGARAYRLNELHALNWVLKILEALDFSLLKSFVEDEHKSEEELLAEVTERIARFKEG